MKNIWVKNNNVFADKVFFISYIINIFITISTAPLSVLSSIYNITEIYGTLPGNVLFISQNSLFVLTCQKLFVSTDIDKAFHINCHCYDSPSHHYRNSCNGSRVIAADSTS
jgi:hypothetical protein